MTEPGAVRGPAGGPAATRVTRLVVLDPDTAFTRPLLRRALDGGLRAELAIPVPAVDAVAALRPTAIVLDPAAVPGDPWEYVKRLSETCDPAAVLVCAGPSSLAERVRGLRLGADDWITKPSHPEEVLARVDAAVRARRTAIPAAGDERIAAGPLEIRDDLYDACVDGVPLSLTRREFELLRLLAATPGRVLAREQIYAHVWGYVMAHGDRSVDVYVRKLRRKLERASPGWAYLHTHFGVGYRFEAQLRDG